ncbi:MAG: cytochrome P450 [Gammaproteobacteria bacterium]|nr:cytochrome P450 [Gammaproteobacteria bacterium]
MAKEEHLGSYDAFKTNLSDLWANWEIDVDQDPYTLPLDDFMCSHPYLFREHKVLPYFERLRAEAPVHFTASSPVGPYWDITKFNDIVEIEKDFKTFSSEMKYGGITLGGVPYDNPDPTFSLPMFIAMDPPKHDDQRKIVQPKFTQGAINELEQDIRRRAQAILDGLPRNETFNWVEHVSRELTGQMLAQLFDIPQEDRFQLLKWSDTIQNASNVEHFNTIEDAFKVLWECHTYFAEVWQEKLKQKEPGNDLVSMLAFGEATKDMPPNEYLGNVLLLIVAGNDTTRNSISGGLLALNEFPDQYTKLKNDRGVIPGMVSEMIRFQSPVAHMARTALRDTEFRGHEIKEGDRIALWYISGNRDEEVIPHANEFIIDRPNVRNHLGFGVGIHRCMGSRLGEMQLRVLWEEIEDRFERIEVDGDPKYLQSAFINGIRELPVRIAA